MTKTRPATNTRHPADPEDFPEAMRRDRARLARLQRAGGGRKFESLLETSSTLKRTRAAHVPAPEFDQALPITGAKAGIQQAIRDNQVVVVCGETGSGKSTQLPKFCLEMGRGIEGFIGHTQPRRVAARSIAARLCDELGGEIGGPAGYKYRFADQVGEQTYIKVLTDGMLLAELESDRNLDQYDTLIIDEAHERSLNIDFLLGALKRLLPSRRELRVIITSATIDPGRFAAFFDDAPIIEVSGRTWPVEIRYRPFDLADADAGERNLEVALLHAVDELCGEGPGDILVFLPGEFHIHKTAELLRRKHLRNTEILPLYARLSATEQQRVFRPGGARRIVLATNVAETSITVPGIRYVVDTGLARVSRYRPGHQVQALPIEAISRAAAQQRAGRCGREADGVCIRLYSEEDFDNREAFTPPEVQRTSLASVILSMHHLGLGSVEEFAFIDPPPERMVRAGYRLLEELGATDSARRLTDTGRRLARIPADPRIGRMLLASEEHRCAAEVLTIAAALSIQDPRNHPEHAREQARRAHAVHRHDSSDFLSLLQLWELYRRETRGLSGRRRARYCRDHFLSVARMREWRNLRDQLRHTAEALGIGINASPASEAAIHKALLTGLLGNIAQRQDGNEYLGTRGKKLFIHPSSALFKSRPRWLMCAELVQTRRLYARTVAAIDPGWVERPAGRLIRREYLDPVWDADRGEVIARERLSLFGLVLVRGRKIAYSAIDEAVSREVFIRQGLVPGNLTDPPGFVRHNLAMIGEVEHIEQRIRQRGLAIDDEQMFRFYDRLLPADVHDLRGLDRWLRRASAGCLQALRLEPGDARSGIPVADYPDLYPESLRLNGNRLPLHYRFDPGHPRDGVTLGVPLPLARQLDPARLSWLVPGLLAEKIAALIKSQPKPRRRGIGPAGDAALDCLQHMDPEGGESLAASLSRALRTTRGVDIPAADWDENALPDHLRMNIEVIDGHGEVLLHGRDPDRLRHDARSQEPEREIVSDRRPDWLRDGLTDWSCGELPETLQYRQAGMALRSFVALRDHGDSVAVELFNDEQEARASMATGLRRLLRLRLGSRIGYLERNLPDLQRMCLNFAPVGRCESLKQDIIETALAQTSKADPWSVRDAAGFEQTARAVESGIVPAASEICGLLSPALDRFRECLLRLDSLPAASRSDIAQQLDLLVFPGFVFYTPPARLSQFDRYLKGVLKRIERCIANPAVDLERMQKIQVFWGRLLAAYPPPPDPVEPALFEFRWLLEEFRISVFAQEIGAALPVSAKRLEHQWRAVESGPTEH